MCGCHHHPVRGHEAAAEVEGAVVEEGFGRLGNLQLAGIEQVRMVHGGFLVSGQCAGFGTHTVNPCAVKGFGEGVGRDGEAASNPFDGAAFGLHFHGEGDLCVIEPARSSLLGGG